jgi:hypothetical protein
MPIHSLKTVEDITVSLHGIDALLPGKNVKMLTWNASFLDILEVRKEKYWRLEKELAHLEVFRYIGYFWYRSFEELTSHLVNVRFLQLTGLSVCDRLAFWLCDMSDCCYTVGKGSLVIRS